MQGVHEQGDASIEGDRCREKGIDTSIRDRCREKAKTLALETGVERKAKTLAQRERCRKKGKASQHNQGLVIFQLPMLRSAHTFFDNFLTKSPSYKNYQLPLPHIQTPKASISNLLLYYQCHFLCGVSKRHLQIRFVGYILMGTLLKMSILVLKNFFLIALRGQLHMSSVRQAMIGF